MAALFSNSEVSFYVFLADQPFRWAVMTTLTVEKWTFYERHSEAGPGPRYDGACGCHWSACSVTADMAFAVSVTK